MILSRSSSSAELLARLASGGLAGSSSGLGAATGHGFHDASAWMASWQTMAASNLQQLRCKVFTSNVMDDTRSQRIAERRAYMLAKKEWRKEVNHRLLQWRAELKAAELEARAAAAKIRADTEAHGGGEHPALAAQQHLLKMQEELRKAQLDHDVVRVFSGWRCFGTARLAEREFTNTGIDLLDWDVLCQLSSEYVEASLRDDASFCCAWLPAGGIATGEGAPVTGARGTAGSSTGCKVRYAATCAPLYRHTQLHSPSKALSLCGLLQNCHRQLGMTAHLVFMGDEPLLSVHHLTCVKCSLRCV